MLSIQEVGTEILGKNPGKFYVMIGTEYGIKMKYINMISDVYGSEVVESPSVSNLMTLMSTKHFIPLKPKVYVVRYDDEFLTGLDASSEETIRSSKIVGTIVVIYEGSKNLQKLDKYLPNYTVSIDNVSSKYLSSYLHKDFPNLPDKLIYTAVRISSDYNNAVNICNCMSAVPVERLYSLDDSEFDSLFGHSSKSNDAIVRKCIASKNFSSCMKAYTNYTGTDDEFIYNILSTMIELEKILGNKFVESDIRKYEKLWKMEDVYNMFMNTYSEINKLRSYSQSSEESIIYLLSLLSFLNVPSVEVMSA